MLTRKNWIVYFFCLFYLALGAELFALKEKDIPIISHSENDATYRKAKIAICCVFQNEAFFLKEWLEYHLLIGVKHFYLYNNLSTDHFEEVLKPYVKKGIVELFEVPFDSSLYNDGAKTHNLVQVACYNHAIKKAKNKNKWLGIIDADEFITPVIDESLSKALKRYKGAEGLALYWQVYGTSNIWELNPNELMIEKLTRRMENNSPNGLFKMLVRPRFAKCENPHLVSLEKGYLICPNYQRFSHSPTFEKLPVEVLRINHYTYRTESYYYNVKKPRRARWGDNPDPELERFRLDSFNAVEDPVMLRFVPKLKERLEIK